MIRLPGKYLTDNSPALLLCQRHYQNFTPRQKFPYVRKSYLVSHEIQFSDGQAGIGQHRPIVWPAFNLANFSRFDGL